MLDWGVCSKLTLNIRTDSSAAKGFAARRGLGRQRHVSIRLLWWQDKVSKGELRMAKVDTSEQLADFLTKPVTAKWLAEKSPGLGLELREGRPSCNVDSIPDVSFRLVFHTKPVSGDARQSVRFGSVG